MTGAPPGAQRGQAKNYLSAAVVRPVQDPAATYAILMSCKTAIKAGTRLTDDEAVACSPNGTRSPSATYCRDYCPHGRPVTVRFTERELEKMFKRKK